MQQVIVVGGGLGGLLVGAELQRRGMEPLVLEGSDRPGGVARTLNDGGFLLEPAAGSVLLPNPDLSPIFEAAGVRFVAARAAAHTRFVYDRDTLFEVPESPKILLTRLVSWRAKLRAAREPWVKRPAPSGEESLLGFFTRRFGGAVGRLAADLMAHGVFAGDPDLLSIQAAFPKMAALEAEAGSLVRGALRRRRSREEKRPRPTVHVAPEGMADVARQLRSYLGDRFRTECPVESISREDGRWRVAWDGGSATSAAVVVAVAPGAATNLLPDGVAALFSSRPVAPVAVVGLGGAATDFALPEGFGVLAGPDASIRALGVLFESSYAPGRAPEGFHLAKGIYGGSADPEVMARTDEELIALMQSDLERLLGHALEPTWTRVVRSAIPQYPIGHAGWLEQVDGQLRAFPGLHLAGWGYRGIGLSALGSDAVAIASALEDPRSESGSVPLG